MNARYLLLLVPLLLVLHVTTSPAAVPRGADSEELIKLRGHSDIVAATMTTSELNSVVTACFLSGDYALVRFFDAPSTSDRSELADSGIVVLGYVPYMAWLVDFTAIPSSGVYSDYGIAWAGAYLPEYKASDTVKSGDWGTWAITGSGEALVIATFHSNVERDDAETVLGGAGVSSYGLFSQTPKLKYVLSIDPNDIDILAESAEVLWIDQIPAPIGAVMNIAGPIVGADIIHSVPYELTGMGTHVAIFEGFYAAVNHNDMNGPDDNITRVFLEDPEHECNTATDFHAAGVAGVIGSEGQLEVDGNVYPGIAPETVILSREWTGSILDDDPGDLNDDLLEVIDGWSVGGQVRKADVANFSIGYRPDSPITPVGRYNELARLSDHYSTRYLQEDPDRSLCFVWATGNAGRLENWDPLVSTVGAGGVGKNVISATGWKWTIGDGEYCIGCGIGPTEDGRLGPDLCAPHVGLWTMTCDSYWQHTGWGTSFATPMISGAAALVIEKLSSLGYVDPPPSLIRAILTAGAVDCLLEGELPRVAPSFPGPDIYTGHGLLNIPRSIDILDSGKFGTYTIRDGEDCLLPFYVSVSTDELRVNIAWDDQPPEEIAEIDVVNDIDLALVDPSGNTHLPYVIDPNNPLQPASPGVNDYDNIEQCIVSAPEVGTWWLKAKGTSIVEEFDLSHGDGVDGQLFSYAIHLAPEIVYKNVSAETNLNHLGNPTTTTTLDWLGTGQPDGFRDLFINQSDAPGQLFQNEGPTDGVPRFEEATLNTFDFIERPLVGHGGTVSVDLNRDGLEDLVMAAGSSSEFRIYLQDESPAGHYSLFSLPTSIQNDLNASSWSVACGDYDLDGQVDIYVCRATPDATEDRPGPDSTPLPDILLRNDFINLGTFSDVTADIIGTVTAIVSTGAAWGDYDADGDLDLAVADGGSSTDGLRIYVNDDQALVKGTMLVLPPEIPANQLSDVAWADFDGDSDLDLLATSYSDDWPTYAFVNNINVGTLTFALGTFPQPEESSKACLRVLDQNLDGYLDVLVTPGEADEPAQLFVNHSAPLGAFRSNPNVLGLGAIPGVATTAIATDLNGDGGSELFFGRTVSSESFLCTAVGDGVSGSSPRNWVGLRLFQPEGSGFAGALGSRVVFHMPDSHEQTMVVGGGGNGSADHTIILGLGDSASSITCDIYWQSGKVQLGVSLAANTWNEILEDPSFYIIAESEVGTYEVKPGEIVDWIFRWSTSYRTDMELDLVTLVNIPPPPCDPGVTELAAGDPGVVCRQWRDETYGWFNHELRWVDVPCESPCNFTFTATSGRADQSETSGAGSLKIKFCTHLGGN